MPAHLASALHGGAALVAALDWKEQQTLVAAGLLVEDIDAHRQQVFDKLARDNGRLGVRMFVLLPTAYCNMGCAYCGQAHSKASLTGQHRDAAIKRVLAAMQQTGTKHVHVAWFGGEPLIAFAALTSMAEEIVAGVQRTGIEYSSKITTNGALLDERKLSMLVNECLVRRFDITIDGPADVHDVHRPLKSGHPTFERLVTFLADVIARDEYRDVRFILRTNIDCKNATRIGDYLAEMAERGFAGRRNVTFQLSPIHSWGNDITDLQVDQDRISRLEIEWFKRMRELNLNFATIPSDVVGPICVATNRESEVLSANGAVFSCTEHPLVPEHEAGSSLIQITGLAPSERRPVGQYDGWTDDLISPEQQCSSCALLPVCGGHCPKLWKEGRVACPSMKYNMPQRLSLLAEARGLAPRSNSPLGPSLLGSSAAAGDIVGPSRTRCS